MRAAHNWHDRASDNGFPSSAPGNSIARGSSLNNRQFHLNTAGLTSIPVGLNVMPYYVNYFTYVQRLARRFRPVCLTKISRRKIPRFGRTVRRVHVMPRATIIRRIGRMLAGYLCPEPVW